MENTKAEPIYMAQLGTECKHRIIPNLAECVLFYHIMPNVEEFLWRLSGGD